MNRRTAGRRMLCGAATVFLVVLAWWATRDGLRNWNQAERLGQTVQAVVEVASGLLSAAVVVTRFRWGFLSVWVRGAWMVALVATTGLSALVWGPSMPHIAVLFACVALLLAWGVVSALGRPVTSCCGDGRSR